MNLTLLLYPVPSGYKNTNAIPVEQSCWSMDNVKVFED